MGLDTLSDNTISADFTDDAEELFDTKEFIDLNEDTDIDMGLKFQDRKAQANTFWMD